MGRNCQGNQADGSEAISCRVHQPEAISERRCRRRALVKKVGADGKRCLDSLSLGVIERAKGHIVGPD